MKQKIDFSVWNMEYGISMKNLKNVEDELSKAHYVEMNCPKKNCRRRLMEINCPSEIKRRQSYKGIIRKMASMMITDDE
jgi:hypothetical protein